MKKLLIALLVLLPMFGAGCTWEETLAWDDIHDWNPGTTNHMLVELGHPSADPGAVAARRAAAASQGFPWPWDELQACEAPPWSGGWSANTGNGYYGGLQFKLSTWHSVGGRGYPHQASPAEQVHRATILRDQNGGYGAWPNCSRKLGLPR